MALKKRSNRLTGNNVKNMINKERKIMSILFQIRVVKVFMMLV